MQISSVFNTLVIVAAKMIGRRRRMTPEEDAIENILLGRDKPFLEARFIDTFKGKVFMSYSIILMPFKESHHSNPS